MQKSSDQSKTESQSGKTERKDSGRKDIQKRALILNKRQRQKKKKREKRKRKFPWLREQWKMHLKLGCAGGRGRHRGSEW